MKIEMRDIVKTFGDKQVLKGINFTVDQPGIHCISGPSGSGKTTLLYILMGLLAPDQGQVLGTEHIRFSPVFAEDRLLPTLTVYENVLLVSKNQKRSQDYLSALGLGEGMDLYPKALSTGMKRRAALARALAYGGDVLVLDEPFKGLDDQIKSEALDLIQSVGEKSFVVFVSHDIEMMHSIGVQVLNLI